MFSKDLTRTLPADALVCAAPDGAADCKTTATHGCVAGDKALP